MEFFIVLIVACGVFALCFAVFLLKGRRSDGPPRLHTCGQGDDCQCHGQPSQKEPFDLMETLGKIKQEPVRNCQQTKDLPDPGKVDGTPPP